MIKIVFSLVLTALLHTSATAEPEADAGRRQVGALEIEGIPEIPDSLSQRLQQYENNRSATLADWLPSGDGILVRTRFGDTSQIHRVGKPGGTRHQLTFFDEPVRSATVSPDPDVNGFLYRKDVGGSEFYQIYLFDLATGISRLMTDGESLNGSALWSNQGDRFAFYSTRRNGKDFDVYVRSLEADSNAELVLAEGGAWDIYDWSPDDQRLLVEKYVSRGEAYLYMLDIASRELTPVAHGTGKVSIGGAMFARDRNGIYYSSDEDSEFRTLRFLDLDSGETRVISGHVEWDIEEFDLSDDGRYLAYTVNQDAVSRLQVLDTKMQRNLSIPELPTGQVYGVRFAPDGRRLGIVLNSPRTPGDAFVLDLGNEKLTRWTFSETGGLDSSEFVEPGLIRYPTFDKIGDTRRTIPAFYYRPSGEGPFPVLISIHGGPESQRRPAFSPTTQFVVGELGIAVLSPNVRGSTGYGKSFMGLDNGRLREDSVRDIGALLDWIESQPDLDSGRVAVLGGSYGGYMVAASMTHYNDRLRAGVNVVGISNFVTFLENTQDYRRDLRRAEYGDERDPDMRMFLQEISPLNNAHKINRAMFIAQGLNDPRVPASESEQMLAAIRDNGGEAWYMLATDEGHGFAKKKNRDYFRAAMILFLEKQLLSN